MKLEQGVIGELNWKVYLGDCKDVLQEMINNNEFVDTIMTSPPFFNRRSYAGKPKIDGNIAKWVYASQGNRIKGEIGNTKDKDKYIKDIEEVLQLCYGVLRDNRFMFINIANTRENFEVIDFSSNFIEMAKKIGFIHWDTLIWIKKNPQPAGKHKAYYLANGWEYILAFTKGKKNKINTEQLKVKTHFKCKYCQEENYIDSKITPNYLYSYVGCYGRTEKSNITHPAKFPIDIPKFCLSMSSKVGYTILDPFAGSGTTLIAGLEQGLNVIGCELVANIYDDLIYRMNSLSEKNE